MMRERANAYMRSTTVRINGNIITQMYRVAPVAQASSVCTVPLRGMLYAPSSLTVQLFCYCRNREPLNECIRMKGYRLQLVTSPNRLLFFENISTYLFIFILFIIKLVTLQL